ncbi:MAG: ribosome biogenesis GTPase Der [Planctomycetes bacterium]|nr:ribosome biogenesis GTPase Der [Planctomycetota bacterium]
MPVPKVVIVGRPNVGKSSLLNWLARKRISIVEPTAGVTRDRVTYLMHEGDQYFELVDTGGIGVVDSDDLSADIEQQINTGIDEATLILFVVDGSIGRVPLDLDVSTRLRKVKTPILLVVNKCDSPKNDHEVSEFYALADAPLVCTSVLGDRNRDKLLKAILRMLPPADDFDIEEGERVAADPELKLAIVGRRNVGKSTFINALAQTERMIVSEIPGTTRDSVDVRFELDGKSFVAIDTPGVRKKKSLANDIEFYGLTRALRSIRRADVVLMFFDASQTISMVDKQLVGEIAEQYKPCIFVINKWDLGQEAQMTTEKWSKYLIDALGSMKHVPVAFITAKDEVNVKKLINLAQTIAKQAQIRVPTAKLNAAVQALIERNHPPMRGNRPAKIYFATQIGVAPPTIVVKCNDPKLIDKGWQRYLVGALHDMLPFPEVPIKVYYRSRVKAESTDPSAEHLDNEPEPDVSEMVFTGDEPLDLELPPDDA